MTIAAKLLERGNRGLGVDYKLGENRDDISAGSEPAKLSE
jgi:hypothetical protein